VPPRPFEFEWAYPDAAGFQRMRVRLKALLDDPNQRVAHAYFLHTLLKRPRWPSRQRQGLAGGAGKPS